MKEKYQVLHLTPATSPPDTLRPGRPKDPIPGRVCLAASAPFDRREARIRENNGKKSEGTPYWEGTKLLREQQKFISMSNQGWSSLMYVTYSHPELSKSSPHESSSGALCHGWPSTKFSATSAGNSSSLGGSMKRFRAQCSGGLQGRPRAHTSLIQDSRTEIACLMNEPRETPRQY